MNRRSFLISAGIVGAFTSIPFARAGAPAAPLLLNGAYSLWYNRPAVAVGPGGFLFGYVTSNGEVLVSAINDQLKLISTSRIHKFEDASDHGSPSLIRVPSGKHEGSVLACFSNHSSPLMCSRTPSSQASSEWSKARVIDSGRSTYASLAALPDGSIILMHTQQERIGRHPSGEWRRVVARTTKDGGDTWSEAIMIAGEGAGTFPYSTALSVSGGGKCAMAYAIYSAAEKRHIGLTVVVTQNAFQSKTEIPIDLGLEAHHDTVPYETRWISDSVIAVSYSQVSADGKSALSRLVTVDVDTGRQLQNVSVLPVAVHTYAGGAAIEASGKSLICSPVTGGLVRKYLDSDTVEEIVTAGEYSSPWVFNAGSQNMLVALKNPYVKTTRDFGSDILIMPLP